MRAATGDRRATSAGSVDRTASRVVLALATAIVTLVGCALIVIALTGISA
jgi:hypothetical protein